MTGKLCDKCMFAEKKYYVDEDGNIHKLVLCKELFIYVYEEIIYNPFYKRKHGLLQSSKVKVDRRRRKCRYFKFAVVPLTRFFK